MNIEKMRRQNARNTPEAVWKTFDKFDPNFDQKFKDWSLPWGKKIGVKHRGRIGVVTISRVDLEDDHFKMRVQLVHVPR